jgi:hypothetical protein
LRLNPALPSRGEIAMLRMMLALPLRDSAKWARIIREKAIKAE